MSEFLDMNQMRQQQQLSTAHSTAQSQSKEAEPQTDEAGSGDQENLLESGYSLEELKDIKSSLTGLIPSGSQTVRIQNKKKTYVAMITQSYFTYQKKGQGTATYYRFQFKDGQVFSKNSRLEAHFLDKFYAELDTLAQDIEKDQVNYFKA